MAGLAAFFGDMPWPTTIEAWLPGFWGLRSRRSIDPLRLRRLIILWPLNILLLHGSNHHLLWPRLLVGQPWALWSISRRSSCDLALSFLNMVSLRSSSIAMASS